MVKRLNQHLIICPFLLVLSLDCVMMHRIWPHQPQLHTTSHCSIHQRQNGIDRKGNFAEAKHSSRDDVQEYCDLLREYRQIGFTLATIHHQNIDSATTSQRVAIDHDSS